jgi:hypothetical protein
LNENISPIKEKPLAVGKSVAQNSTALAANKNHGRAVRPNMFNAEAGAATTQATTIQNQNSSRKNLRTCRSNGCINWKRESASDLIHLSKY